MALDILKTCEQKISFSELQERLTNATDKSELNDLVTDMISLKMLLTDEDSNIIGPDYLKKVSGKLSPSKVKYEIATQEYLSGTIDQSILRHVPELAEKLQQLVAEKESEALGRFVQGFARKFEGREIPLMQVLDPEIGLGYAELEQATGEDDLILGLAGKREKPANKSDQIERFFNEKLGGNPGTCINLEELDLTKTNDAILPLPNTTSMFCSVADDLLVIDMFGGATGAALLGRFTLADENIHQHCVNLCKIEAQSNPDVLFFDIAYQLGNRIDNVNRREQMYEYSLSILDYNTSADPLALSDIMVSVSAGQVLLRSVKHNKRLIPRMASAYNHTKSDLSVFRFLSDLQHQGIQSFLICGG